LLVGAVDALGASVAARNKLCAFDRLACRLSSRLV